MSLLGNPLAAWKKSDKVVLQKERLLLIALQEDRGGARFDDSGDLHDFAYSVMGVAVAEQDG